MDVVGTASAVIGIVQVGFSLAKAIRETVKDYKDAADDLIGLAQDIESTLHLVSELEVLVLENDKTGMFNVGGLAELNKCHKNTERIVEALVELLTKTGISHQPGTKIKPEDLIISRSNRRNWLGQRSRVKDKQEELNKVRLEVITIIQFAKVLQTSSSGEKAVQQALLLMSERERRRKIRARRKKQKRSAQTQQPDQVNHKSTAGAHRGRASKPLTSRFSDDGSRAFESFAHRAEPHKPITVAFNIGKYSTEDDTNAEGGPALNKAADDSTVNDKMMTDNDANDRNIHSNVANGKKDNHNTLHNNKATGSTMDTEALPRPAPDANNTATGPQSLLSPLGDRPRDEDQRQLSREAIIEEFKSQTKADASKLADMFQVKMERAATHLARNESEHGLRKFLESELAQEWSDLHGDWLPNLPFELLTVPNNHTNEIEMVKLRRYVISYGRRGCLIDLLSQVAILELKTQEQASRMGGLRTPGL